MVESSKCWLLIGRKVPQKFLKGGTLTILNMCQSSVIDLNWHWIGSSQVLANRPLASIEASERLAILQMNPVLLRQGPMNQMDSIGPALELHLLISGLANRLLASIEASE